MLRDFDIVRVIHYQSGNLAGRLGEVRAFVAPDAVYVEFNDRAGNTDEGQILNVSWLEWVYSPNGWQMSHYDGADAE